MTLWQIIGMSAVYVLLVYGMWFASVRVPLVCLALLGLIRLLVPYDDAPPVISDPGETLHYAYFVLCFFSVMVIAFRNKRRWAAEARAHEDAQAPSA